MLSAKHLAGDLDAITLKALAKRAEDRYPSAEQLAADLERHNRSLPIRARPPRLEYRLRKAISRHRAFVISASLAGLLILGFVLALMAQPVAPTPPLNAPTLLLNAPTTRRNGPSGKPLRPKTSPTS